MPKDRFRLIPLAQGMVQAMALSGFAVAPGAVWAQLVISDSLTGISSSYNWYAINGACLTAGTYSAGSTSTIPGCTGLPYYSGKTLVGGVSGRLPDPIGQGALRLTNGDVSTSSTYGTQQTGAVVSNFTFPSGQGLQVTFTTVTYGGNAYTNSSGVASGADGIAFFLMDGARSPNVGAYGGSLGYSCANSKSAADGVLGGYIGLGIDEFGNFSNPDDNTATPSGGSQSPGTIALRGAGNVTWAWLNANYPGYYPSWLSGGFQSSAVQKTCASGTLWNYSYPNMPRNTGIAIQDYKLLSKVTLPSNQPIANQQAISNPVRGNAVPITYALSITQDGLLNLSYSYNGGAATSLMTNQSITSLNGSLPSTFRFGFSAGTGGGSNVHEITCFKASQISGITNSASVNAQQSSRVQAGSQIYLSYYHPTNDWGQLTAQSLVYDNSTDTVSISALANWDASCVLTGGNCSATGGSNTAQGSAARTLLTWSGTSGVPFQWGSLTSAQQSALTAGGSTPSSRLNYLRGDRSLEINSNGVGTYRSRDSVLGDIMGSSPAWVGPPSLSYSGTWKDLLYPTTAQPETGYATFKANYATRMHVVYVGANDGFLHGFRAGANDSAGSYSTSTHPNDGREVLGYMPSQVLGSIHPSSGQLDFSGSSYSHNAYVDATPGSGDIFYKGAWRTWVVGGLGAGGNATGVIGDKTSTGTGTIFALDVTNPSTFSEANAASIVIGEVNSGSLQCANTTPAGCGGYLGNTYGTPLIRRLHNGQWAVIYGNGFNSANGTAGIFVTTFDAGTGAATTRFLSTGYGPSRDPNGGGSKNGIGHVASADLDGDHITDYVYAGDVFGYLWRFDLTSNDPANWAVKSTPVLSTGGLPITVKPTVSSVVASSGLPRVMLGLGTGQAFPQTLANGASYASGTHYMLGVWDADLTDWNGKGSAQYASLSSTSTVFLSNLVTQTVTTYAVSNGNISGYRTVSNNPVCWSGTTSCAGGASANTQLGWKIALPGSGEQVVYNPTLNSDQFVVNTTVPAQNRPLSCTTTVPSGYTMAVLAATGAPPTASFFASASGNYTPANGEVVAGLGLSGSGSPSFVKTKGKTLLVQQTSGGTGVATVVNPAAANQGRRVNWIRLR